MSRDAGPVAAIDIGTNSVLLLIAERRGGALVALEEHATITRLGENVDKARRLEDAAVARTLACLEHYGARIRACGCTRVDATGTSAMRDAAGGERFREAAGRLLGVEPRVISGAEEARLTFFGGLSAVPVPAGPVVVFDIGGGSTEIIRGEIDAAGHARVDAAISLDIGSVRLTERHVRSDPPTPAEIAAVGEDVARELARAPSAERAALVGVAGTVTTLAAIARSVDPYDASRIHGAELRDDEIFEVAERLARLPLAQRVKLPGLSPKRADVIVAGATLCATVLRKSGARSLWVSDRGVRWGLAEELAPR